MAAHRYEAAQPYESEIRVMMRGKTLKPIRRRCVAVLGLVALAAVISGVAERAGADGGAQPAAHVVAWNSTSASCVTCTTIG
ncbi:MULTISPECIES: hypothetical protein [unclassified Streptomyces]|uniref:hypothetical protein n=1 Tax=unclassified Streptomyces TaxID=2593676 RepID=UPI0033BB85C9